MTNIENLNITCTTLTQEADKITAGVVHGENSIITDLRRRAEELEHRVAELSWLVSNLASETERKIINEIKQRKNIDGYS